MKTSFLLSFVLLIFFSSCSRGKEDFRTQASEIETPDRVVLDNFFSILIKQNEFGYNLFGNKPVSILSYPVAKQDEINNLTLHPALLDEGWAVWQKYSSLFPSKNFTLFMFESTIRGMVIHHIGIINQEAVRTALKTNQEIFSSIGNNLSLDILQIFQGSNPCSLLGLGILYGYGYNNPKLFERRENIALFYLSHPQMFAADRDKMTEESLNICFMLGELAESSDSFILEPSENFHTLVEEFNFINSNTETFELDGAALGITPFSGIRFVCFENETEENNRLRESYEATLNTMIRRYANNSFLEVTLDQWVNG